MQYVAKASLIVLGYSNVLILMASVNLLTDISSKSTESCTEIPTISITFKKAFTGNNERCSLTKGTECTFSGFTFANVLVGLFLSVVLGRYWRIQGAREPPNRPNVRQNV